MYTGFLSRGEGGMLSVLANFNGVIEGLKRKKNQINKDYLLVDSLKK